MEGMEFTVFAFFLVWGLWMFASRREEEDDDP